MPQRPHPCPFCSSPNYSFTKYLRHLRLFHESENNFMVKCHIKDCNKVFSKVSNYYRHDYRNHSTTFFTELAPTVVSSANNIATNNRALLNDDVQEYDLMETQEMEYSESKDEALTKEAYKYHFASFLLAIREKHSLPVSMQDTLISELKLLSNIISQDCRLVTEKGLAQLGMSLPNAPAFASFFLEGGTNFEQAVDELDSTPKFNSFIASNFPFIAPCQYLLAAHDANSKYDYIPVTDLLKAVISKPDVYEQIKKDQHFSHSSNVLYDTCDGERHKNKETSRELVLHLQFYIDEFELCNPIGARRGKHKLTAVYFTIGNLPKRYRNLDNTVFLSILAKHKYIRLYDPTYKTLFEPLLCDLEVLRNGVTFTFNGEQHIFKAVLDFIIADNLSSHAVSGFQTNFSSGRFCRSCMIDYSQFREKLSISNLTERSNDLYDYQVATIDQFPEDAMVNGLKHKCAFSKLPYFKVVDSFPPDVMHDCLEGIIPSTVLLVLKELVTRKLVSISELNDSLVRAETSSRPNFFPDNFLTSKRLVGTASQKLELFYLLPQIVNLSVLCNCAAWEVYLSLRECMDYILSPVIEKDALPYLSDCIESYLLKFKDTFGANNIIPKHHFMMHFPNLIIKYGPLRNFWCMHFEEKHQYFKKLISNLRNFKNVTHTLASRHQMRLAHALSSQFLTQCCTISSSCKRLTADKLPNELRLALEKKIAKSLTGKIIDSVRELTINGLTYRKKQSVCYILECLPPDSRPCFAQPKHILHINGKWYICLKVFLPVQYMRISHSYEVEYQKDWLAVFPEELTDVHKHRIYRKNYKTFAYTIFHVTEFHKGF